MKIDVDEPASTFKNNPLRFTNQDVAKETEAILKIIDQRDSLRLTIKRLREYERKQIFVRTEAESEIVSMNLDKDIDTYENFEDIAGSTVDSTDYGNPEVLDTGQVNLLDMGDFLSRPVKIAQSTAAVGSNFTFSVDAWNLYLSHPAVRAKLKNFAYLNATLMIRITVSGTTWHYGKFQVSYQPLAGFNANLTYVIPQLATSQRIVALTYLSQGKGATTMDVHDNKPLEIACPFISPQPMGRLYNKSPLILAAAGGYDDFTGFGTLYINSIGTVKAVGAAATPVGVQVYAWMEDLKLGCPTGTVIEIGTESKGSKTQVKKGKDEREAGPVEAISSKAAGIASALTQVPVIGSFASAAVAPLKMLSGVASLFGFSYPTLIDTPTRMKNEPFQNSSQWIGCDTGQRLTIDPKQELSVDPRATGTDLDEMSYSHLCAVESLVDTFTWATSDGQMASSIWLVPVNPNIAKRVLVSAGPPATYVVAPTALGFTAIPHVWWRGDITFRFEIVCSKFHRGSLAVLYEPNISQNVVIDTTLDLNKQYIKKVDLQSVTDFEVTVKWALPRPWARVLTTDLYGDLGAVGFLGDSLFDYANGYLAVVPYTELQSPDGSSITINVYVKSDNMHFNQYTLEHIPTARPSVESLGSREPWDLRPTPLARYWLDIGTESDGSYSDHTPNPVERMDLNESSAKDDNICSLNFGEAPLSFRSALRRFSAWRNNGNVKITAATTAPIIRYQTYPWSAPTPSYNTLDANANPNLFGYLRLAYLGWRGGIKWRFGMAGPINSRYLHDMVVRLDPPTTSVPSTTLTTQTDYQMYSCRASGSAMFVPTTNGGIEVEWPMYTTNLFLMSFNKDVIPTTSIMDNLLSQTLSFHVPTNGTSATATDSLCAVTSCAAAEDFSLMRFSGAPVYTYTFP